MRTNPDAALSIVVLRPCPMSDATSLQSQMDASYFPRDEQGPAARTLWMRAQALGLNREHLKLLKNGVTLEIAAQADP